MGCIPIAMKQIADVQVDERRKAESGPGLAQFLHWRGAAMLCVLSFWMVAEVLNLCEVLHNYKITMDTMSGPLALQMRTIIWMNSAINVLCVMISMYGWFVLLQGYSKRRSDFGASIAAVRKAYILDFGSFVIFYLVIPLAFFFRTDLLQRDMCVYSLYSLLKGGPITRQAMASAAMTKGDAALAALCQTSPPPVRGLSDWGGYAWCNARPNFIEYLFGPDPATAAYSPTTSQHAGIIPQVVIMLSAITGAKCNTPALHGTPSVSLADVADPSIPFAEVVRKGMGALSDTLARRAAAIMEQASVSVPESRVGFALDSFDGLRTTTDCSVTLNSTHCFDIWRSSLAADSRSLPPGDMLTAQTVVCQFAASADVTADMCRMSMVFVVQVVGLWCAVQAFGKVFPTCTGIIKGLERAAVNVKSVLPTSCLPGYILIAAVATFLPPLCIALCAVTQLMAHPLFCCGFLCLTLYIAWDFKMAECLCKPFGFKDFTEAFKPIEKKKKSFRLYGVIFLILWIIVSMLFANRGSQILNMINLRWLTLNPSSLGYLITNYFYNRILSMIVYTDYLFTTVFAALDDSYRKITDERKMEKAAMLREWYAITEDWVQLAKLSTPEYDCPAPPKPPEPPAALKGKAIKGLKGAKGKGKGKAKPAIVAEGFLAKGKAKGGKGKAKGKDDAAGKGGIVPPLG
mmetsp:Transcript_28396/g.65851  ORF Transcript_28396/g.65851 Transcript_28396/m.65851 type:complete len:687 (-) Transcript_28396:20-2080(-)